MIETILSQALLALPLILGAYLSLSLMKLPDLSLESGYLFGASFAIAMQNLDLPFATSFGLITALLGGAFTGLISSLLNRIFCFPYLLSAIIVNGLFHGLVQLVLGKPLISIDSSHSIFTFLPFSPPYAELGMLLIIAFSLFIVLTVLFQSQLGTSFAIYGNNPIFFKNYGVSTSFVVTTGVMIAHALAGLSGYLFAQSNGFVDLSMGYGVVLMSITSLLLGRIIIKKNRPSVLIPAFGILAYFTAQQILLRLGVNLKYFNAMQAIFIVGALISAQRHRLFNPKHLVDHLGV
jgi:putative tryptophan/tyrosine transport system permease protein